MSLIDTPVRVTLESAAANGMRFPRLPAVAAVVVGFLTACTGPLLAPDDRGRTCRVAVAETYGSPSFRANPMSNPAGGLVGAGGGALAGLAGGFPGAILTVPLGVVIGAVGGTACAVASLNHPTANEEFQQILGAADISILKRSLEKAVNAPRAECSLVLADGSAPVAPDAVIEIEKIELGMACQYGQQAYWIAVQWRVTDAAKQRVLGSTTTHCSQKSSRNIDEWFANPGQARTEIDHTLAKTGQHMAAQLLSKENLPRCTFQSRETGELEAE